MAPPLHLDPDIEPVATAGPWHGRLRSSSQIHKASSESFLLEGRMHREDSPPHCRRRHAPLQHLRRGLCLSQACRQSVQPFRWVDPFSRRVVFQWLDARRARPGGRHQSPPRIGGHRHLDSAAKRHASPSPQGGPGLENSNKKKDRLHKRARLLTTEDLLTVVALREKDNFKANSLFAPPQGGEKHSPENHASDPEEQPDAATVSERVHSPVQTTEATES